MEGKEADDEVDYWEIDGVIDRLKLVQRHAIFANWEDENALQEAIGILEKAKEKLEP